MIFWLLCALLTAIALAFAVPPLLRAPRITEIDRKQLNAALYRERLAELQAQALTAEELAQGKIELEKNLVRDLAEDHPGTLQIKARWAGVAVGIALPALAIGLYAYTGNPAALNPSAVAHAPATTEMPDMEQAVVRLRAKLEKNPEDKTGWHMLARSYMVLDRFKEAAEIYEKLLNMGVPDAQLQADAAEALGLANQNALQGRPEQLIAAALQQDSALPKALWLAGLVAVQKQDYALATTHWDKLLAILPADSDDRAMLEEQLQQIRPHTAENAALATQPTPAATPANATIQATVSLDANLAAHAKPEDTLFIYARAAQGPRMPLAIVRKQVKDLPITVTLDDSMSMMPEMKLSSFQEVIIAARISASGTATPQSGDLLGESAPLKPHGQTAPVVLTINQRIP